MGDERAQSSRERVEPTLADEHLSPGFTVGGKYVIKGLLGEGANGLVYEGEHTEIGHRVAIKVVHQALTARQDIVARFRREARMCGTIRNRHVGQVYDVGELPDGAPYMVMELHEGRSLAQVLAVEGALPIAVVIDIGKQLLIGLQAAHAMHVVHRDVKPDNIMLMRESSGHSVVKLVDFGIGKSVNADISTRNVTQEGVVVGSPDYMPPEQLRGEEVDDRADLYAAGVVLYEAVTGRVPFNAKSLTDLFVAILRDDVVPPRKLRPDCPEELEAVIMRALRRDASQRHQSAEAMRLALEQVPPALVSVDADVLLRYSEPPPPPAHKPPPQRARTDGYALETERVRTAELQVPIRRGGARAVMIAGGVVVLAIAVSFGVRGTRPAAAPAAAPQRTAAASSPAAAGPPNFEAPGPSPSAQPPAAKQEMLPEPEPVVAAPAPPAKSTERSAPRDPLPAHVDGKPAKHKVSQSPLPAAASLPPPAAKQVVKEPELSTPAAAAGPSAAELVQQAAAAFVRGQMPRARALYREATQRAPNDPSAWRGLGMVSSRMGEHGEATRALQRYLSLRPDAPDADAIRKKLSEL
ncbi:MAG: tetratricopeptide repeat protein [Polyangiales bacterium]